MAFPQTLLPLVSQLLIDGAWTTVTSDVLRDDGNGIRIARRPLSWSEANASTSASWTFDNRSLNYYNRRPAGIYAGKIGRNTQARHYLQDLLDTYTRSASSSWGTPDVGPAWTTTGGSASDHSVSAGAGQQSLGTASVERLASIAIPHLDFDFVASGTNSAVPVTNTTYRGVRARIVDANNRVELLVAYLTGDTISIQIGQVVAGVSNYTALTPITGVTSTTAMSFRFQGTDTRLRAKAWATAGEEPDDWTVTYDTTMITPGTLQLMAIRLGTVTSVQSWDNVELRDFRFWGQIPDWTPQADQSGNFKTVPVVAYGLGESLGAGARPLRSALTRAMDGVAEGDFVPVAHWPLEDGTGTTKPGNLVLGGPPAQVSGAVTMAAYSGAAGSDPVPTLGVGGQIAGVFPPITLAADGLGQKIWQYQFMGVVPSSIAADSVFLDISVPDTGGDRIVRLRVQWVNASGILTLRPYDRTGAQVGTGSAIDFGSFPVLFDKAVLFGISIFTVSGSPGFVSAQFAGFLPGSATSPVSFGLNSWSAPTIPVPRDWRAYGNAPNAGWSFSHAAIYTDPAILTTPNQQDNADAIDGFLGELAGVRMPRLAREEGVPFELIGDADDTQPCGPQTSGSLLDNFRTAADADQGILFEPRDRLAIAYRTRASLHNTASLVTLNMETSHHLSTFKIQDDNKTTRNLITARRTNGSFAVAEVTEGGTSTSAPPDGIGIVPEDLTWSLGSDDLLPAFAGWRAHRMGWDEPRYPAVGVQRHRSAIYSDTAVDAGVRALDLGGHYKLTSMRPDLPPDDVELLVQGYDETLANKEHQIVWNNYPQSPYKVFTFDSTTQGRLEGDHFLRTAVNSSATSWEIATASGPLLNTADADDGQQWMIDGELVTVTDVAPSSITFVAAGTASTGSSGSRTPGAPAGIASGDLVLIFASTRNSGTGVPDTPSNWYRYPMFDAASNCQMFGRIYDGVWTMPTVTYTGGAANEDTIAQSAAFRGKFHDITRTYVTSVGRLNASAQDVIAPGVPLTQLPEDFMAIHCAWKQDDYTSAAQAASWTEIQEASTTAGNDASQAWAYRQFTTRPAAGSLQPTYTITGGASAISRGGVLIITSDYQIVTVTRGQNTVTVSHAANAVPKLHPAPHLAL